MLWNGNNCSRFGKASDNCYSLAVTAKCLLTCTVDLICMASRLIAITKNSEVWLIVIGDAARHIIAKSILFIINGDMQDAAGSTSFVQVI